MSSREVHKTTALRQIGKYGRVAKSDKIFNIEHVQGQWHFLPWLDHSNRFNNKHSIDGKRKIHCQALSIEKAYQ